MSINYSRGRKGPESRMQLDVNFVDHVEAGPNSRANGGGVATMAGGRQKAVEFFVQGRHHKAARAYLVAGGTIDATVRWTGGTAVTITQVHGGSTPAEDPVQAAAMKTAIDRQIEAVFG